jgi:hypothetical protein
MVHSRTPRTAMLLRAYCALLAVSLGLSGMLINRHLAISNDAAREIIMPAPRDPNATRGPAPTVKWGGQKR